jgi:hypothetical protein
VFWWYSSDNLSPRVTAEFLARQRRLLLPGQYAREHENQWVDQADSFTTSLEVGDAMDGSWIETPVGEPGIEYMIAVDLGLVHDPAVVGVGHVEGGLVCVDRLVTFQGSREEPVQLAVVESQIVELTRVFPTTRVLVESWQGAGLVQALQRRGLPAEAFAPTAKAVADQWTVLAQCRAARQLVLPEHARLRDELLNLTVEVGPSGPRVTDRGKVHQDHAVVVRMLAAALAPEATAPASSERMLVILGR